MKCFGNCGDPDFLIFNFYFVNVIDVDVIESGKWEPFRPGYFWIWNPGTRLLGKLWIWNIGNCKRWRHVWHYPSSFWLHRGKHSESVRPPRRVNWAGSLQFRGRHARHYSWWSHPS